MKITRECDYAIRIILMLSALGGGGIIDSHTISAEQKIPSQFTVKILRRLLKAGYVKSSKGAHGGYSLNVAPDKLSLYDVVSSIESNALINECFGCGYVCSRVGDPSTCPVHRELDDINRILTEKLSALTFDKLIK